MDLDIYLSGRLVAHTQPVSRGSKFRIAYEAQVDTDYPAETSLLSSMAATRSGVSLDRALHATLTDAVNLLGEYGRECAGAVALVPRGAAAPGNGRWPASWRSSGLVSNACSTASRWVE